MRVSQATSTAHAAMAAMGQAASLRQAAELSIKSVKTTCREEFEFYLSMCQDITIDDMAPTGAAMENFWTEQVFILRTMIFVFRQIYAKPNSAGCLENDFSFAGKTLQPSRSMIDASIFDAQLMSCCNVREYLPAKKDIKEFKSISDALDALPPPGFGAGVYADEDNEEDVPRNAEMFEAASILSAMQVHLFSIILPDIVCTYVSLALYLSLYIACVYTWMVWFLTRVGCVDGSHDQFRP